MNRFINHISTLLLMLLSAIPLTHLVIVSFYLEADQRLPLFLIIAVLFCWLVFSFLPYKVPGIILSLALMLLFFQGRRDLIIEQLKDILDRIAAIFYQHYVNTGYTVSLSSLDHTESMLLFGFALAMLLGIALTAKEERIFLASVICVPIILPCLLVYGYMPWWIMLCLTLFVIMLLSTGRINDLDSNFGRSFFVLVLPVAIALCVLLLFKGPDSYDYESQNHSFLELTEEYSHKLLSLISGSDDITVTPVELSGEDQDMDLSSELPENQWSSDGGKLDATAQMDDDELQNVLMYVTSTEDGYLYLRHNSYGAYRGTGWGSAPEYPGGSVTSFAAQAVESSGLQTEAEITITLASAAPDYLYVPYFCTTAYDTDSHIAGQGSQYTLSYMLYDSGYRDLTLPSQLRDLELSYRQYVYSSYLALPESTSTALLNISQENNLKSDDTLTTIYQVASYVRSSAAYNIDTQPYPSDDYAVYLLTEATEGYCVHFATAATAMYRALGIPARMATGVAVKTVANEQIEVLREDEHAWVEVYIDALGWLPVEVTPGINGGSSPQYSEPEPTDEPEQTASTPSPEPETEPEDFSFGFEEDAPSEAESSQKQSLSTGAIVAIVIICSVLGAVLLFILWYKSRRLIWKRRFAADKDQSAISIWRCARLICSYGAQMPPVIQAGAQKAFYGRGLSSSKELYEMHTALDALRDSTYAGLKWNKKFIFKFIHGLK